MVKNSMSNIIYDVDLAGDIKSFLIGNLDVVIIPNELKKTINNSNDDALLRIGKTIESPINIVSVDNVTPDFFKDNLFKNGNKD